MGNRREVEPLLCDSCGFVATIQWRSGEFVPECSLGPAGCKYATDLRAQMHEEALRSAHWQHRAELADLAWKRERDRADRAEKQLEAQQ